MNLETLAALEASIAHWERMRDDCSCKEEPDSGHCALCGRFYGSTCMLGSEPCPVHARSSVPFCYCTPWRKARRAWHERHVDWPAWQKAAQAEIDFLKSLLPVLVA